MNGYKIDNTIQLVFEKIFNQITLDDKEIYKLPFCQIIEKTFNNKIVHQTINNLTKRPLDIIEKYLLNESFQEKFLFDKLKKKNNVRILLNKNIDVKYIIDKTTIELALLNNRIDIIKVVDFNFTNDLLMIVAEHGYDDIYFYLRNEKKLAPNVNIFYRAILGKSLNIIKDINSMIDISNKIAETAFQVNDNDVIRFIISECDKNMTNYMAYLILNNNLELLKEYDYLVKWHEELYFSALLSGSFDMIKYVEQKIPNIHDNHILDTSKSDKKGNTNLLLEEMIYLNNGQTYFAHTVNYAIQSNKLDIIKYIIDLNYGISSSNIITAIKTGDVDIVKYITKKYNKQLDSHFIYYFGFNSYIPNKFKIAKVLIENGYLNLYNQQKNINNYRRDTLHAKLIEENTTYIETDNYDVDYLMKYYIFFPQIKGQKINNLLITKVRIALELNLDFDSSWDLSNQHIVNTIYLFGNVTQINKHCFTMPSILTIMETLCYNQIGKLCCLINKKLITTDIISELYPLIIILNDNLLNNIVDKFNVILNKPLKCVLESGCDVECEYELDVNNIKMILLTENFELIKKFNILEKIDKELLIWIKENDLIDIISMDNSKK